MGEAECICFAALVKGARGFDTVGVHAALVRLIGRFMTQHTKPEHL
jgi:hypothetical protein